MAKPNPPKRPNPPPKPRIPGQGSGGGIRPQPRGK